MRTNIVLNDELVREAMQYSMATSKRALIEEALGTYVAVKAEERRRRTYRRRLAELRDRLADVSLRSRSADILREDRQR